MPSSFASFIGMKREMTRIIKITIFPETKSLPTSIVAANSTHPPNPAGDREELMKVLGLCFTALGAGTQCLQYVQATQGTTMTLPPTYYLFSSTLWVSLVALVLSIFLPSHAHDHLRSVLEQLGFFFAVVSFFAAITLIFPFWIIFTSWALFFTIILISIIVSCTFGSHISPESSPSSDMHLSSEADVDISPIDSAV